MNLNDDIEAAMLHYMHEHRICAMEELFRNLPAFTTNQMFLTVDRLSREGKVLLRYQNRSEYVFSGPKSREDYPVRCRARRPEPDSEGEDA